MIKIKSKNIDLAPFTKIEAEFNEIIKERNQIRWNGPDDKVAQKARKENEDRQYVKQYEYIKLFFEKFNGRYVRISHQGEKSSYLYLKDATVEPCDKDKSNTCINARTSYCLKPGKSKYITKTWLGSFFHEQNEVPCFHSFRLGSYDKMTITEITKDEFNAVKSNEVVDTEKLPDNVRRMLVDWMMRMPFENIKDSKEYKKVRLETLLAQNRVSLAKERESNFCLKHNLVEAIKTAGKKYAKALTKGYELEIAKSDKKIAQLEKRVEKKEIELGLKKTPKKKK